jgi:hypothetical protein
MAKSPLDSEDTGLVKKCPQSKGYLFSWKMTQEEIDAKKAKYLGAGWVLVDNPGHLSFMSSDGRWYKDFNLETAFVTTMDANWIVNLKSLQKE